MTRDKKTAFILFFNILLFFNNSFAYDIRSCSELEAKTSKALNLVFCSLNYRDKGDFAQDKQMLIRRLRKTKPFDEFQNLRVWSVSLSKEEEADVFKPIQAFPPLKVRNDFLEDISARVKAGYKLVIIDACGSSSCAELSTADKTSLIILGKARYSDGGGFARGFLHELGHSLGLRDECVNCQQRGSAGYPNCAANKEEAQSWWGDLIGKDERVNYLAGCCGNKDHIRPTIASIMNDPDKAEDFGPVNERYLREIFK